MVKDIVNKSVLSNIQCIYFGHFRDVDAENIFTEPRARNNEYVVRDRNRQRIKCQLGRRDPAAKLSGEYAGCLLSACFAWDSNAFPGNEYWIGQLSASGDPAAASCSTIPFVQNPEINKEHLSGENARFYFVDPESGEYEIRKLSDIEQDLAQNEQEWLRRAEKSIPR